MSIRKLTLFAFAASVMLAQPAFADEKLPADQQTKVEEVLKQQGFSTWDEIELDDGMIEVDDAVDAQGKQFDLKLDPKTLEIKSRKEEKKSN